MGNSSSSSGRTHHDETVDYGHLTPQGVYTGPRDWNQAIVSQLICSRRLAPFYRPLEDYDEKWDDDQILSARKELPDSDSPTSDSLGARIETTSNGNKAGSISKRPNNLKEPMKPEAAVYRGAVECPICFLYYPPNINHSRCCDQAICTECFVQIKRSEPTATHLVSEPAACPYCVQENFGVAYIPPLWRAGIGSEGASSLWSDSHKSIPLDASVPYPTHKRRQKSFGADSPEVVTTDQIRPDWEAKLAAVRAAVTRRANRRIIMRQVGDRLIPVGVTSGRVHPLTQEDMPESNETGGSRRSRRRQQQQQNQELNQFMGSMGLGGQDLEELMIMEAMRLSLLEHEEQQRKEAEAKAKNGTSADNDPSTGGVPGEGGPSTSGVASNSSDASLLPSESPPGSRSSPNSAAPSRPPFINEPVTTERLSTSAVPSRNRTPSPTPGDPITTLHALSDNVTSWRRRSSSPPPFTALRAAMSAASTASAVLIQGNSIPPADEASATTTRPLGSATSSSSTSEGTTSPGSNFLSPPERPGRSHSNSFASSIFSADSATETYDTLLSSPESLFSYPLLAADRENPTPSTPALGHSESHTGQE